MAIPRAIPGKDGAAQYRRKMIFSDNRAPSSKSRQRGLAVWNAKNRAKFEGQSRRRSCAYRLIPRIRRAHPASDNGRAPEPRGFVFAHGRARSRGRLRRCTIEFLARSRRLETRRPAAEALENFRSVALFLLSY